MQKVGINYIDEYIIDHMLNKQFDQPNSEQIKLTFTVHPYCSHISCTLQFAHSRTINLNFLCAQLSHNMKFQMLM